MNRDPSPASGDPAILRKLATPLAILAGAVGVGYLVSGLLRLSVGLGDAMGVALACALLGGGALTAAVRVRHCRLRKAGASIGSLLQGLGGDAGPDSRDPVADIERRAAALIARIEPVRHRLVARNRATGLPTREPLLAAMRGHLADRAQGMLGVFEFCDFDRLAAFDPEVADGAIGELARRIVRMVGETALVAQIDRARIGVWLPGGDPQASAAEVDAIGYALSDRISAGDQELVPEIHAGTATAPQDGATPEALIACAISMLGGAQRRVGAGDESGGSAIERAREEFELEQDLRQAVARGEFELVYQPLVDARAQRIMGAEALIRWNHPVRGLVMPARFMPIVENAGLAEEVGMWALNTACRQARQWRMAGLSDLRVAVNLSAHQLARDELPAMIERTMARHALEPGMLEIELTETVAAGDVGRTRALFESLRARGVRIAIDDFGTGYSSLSYLRQLQFDKLKIDREFVTEVDRSPASQAICQSLIALARGLGIRVLAEGVERVEEYRWLVQHGCTLFQGYYFARPVTPAQFAALAPDGLRDRIQAVTPAGLQLDLKEGFAG